MTAQIIQFPRRPMSPEPTYETDQKVVVVRDGTGTPVAVYGPYTHEIDAETMASLVEGRSPGYSAAVMPIMHPLAFKKAQS